MSYRVPALILVAIFAVGLVALDRGGKERTIPRVRVRSVVDGPTVPRKDALSVAWYCAEGTSHEDGRADETILIANLAKAPIDATISVMRGADKDPVVQTRTVEALGQTRVPVSDLADVEEPGVVVELRGGPAIVEHELRNGDAVAVGACARDPSRDWYFTGGTTQRGAEEWLTLFNPFGEDAIVNVSFLTESGKDAPGSTQGVAVARRSRVSLAVHEEAQRENVTAIAVHARIGRVVAERTLLFTAVESGARGLAVSAGATGFASRWRIPLGYGQTNLTQSVSIANFANRPSKVRVALRLEGDVTIEPQTVDVPASSVVRVGLSDRVGEGLYTIDVRVKHGPGVVAETLAGLAPPSTVLDIASTLGAATRAKSWAFAIGPLDGQGNAYIVAQNVSDRSLTVQLYAYTAGDPNSPRSAPARAVAPGELAVFFMSEVGVRDDQVLVVSADGPIVAGRLIAGDALSFALGVPDLSA